mmetsp:Transcript_28192/g.94718  ORF Transcript_28192/g.94718 Transcript_28192/m.94718 type:complete len:244 (+) Transcript_28192:3-734(+)
MYVRRGSLSIMLRLLRSSYLRGAIVRPVGRCMDLHRAAGGCRPVLEAGAVSSRRARHLLPQAAPRADRQGVGGRDWGSGGWIRRSAACCDQERVSAATRRLLHRLCRAPNHRSPLGLPLPSSFGGGAHIASGAALSPGAADISRACRGVLLALHDFASGRRGASRLEFAAPPRAGWLRGLPPRRIALCAALHLRRPAIPRDGGGARRRVHRRRNRHADRLGRRLHARVVGVGMAKLYGQVWFR